MSIVNGWNSRRFCLKTLSFVNSSTVCPTSHQYAYLNTLWLRLKAGISGRAKHVPLILDAVKEQRVKSPLLSFLSNPEQYTICYVGDMRFPIRFVKHVDIKYIRSTVFSIGRSQLWVGHAVQVDFYSINFLLSKLWECGCKATQRHLPLFSNRPK